jgi:hypothetical protein
MAKNAKQTGRVKLSEVLVNTRFHEEITEDLCYREDILDTPIVVYDISDTISRKKGGKVKFDSENKLILMSYEEDETNTKKLCWVSGTVVVDQLERLRTTVEFPSNDGVEMTLTKTEKYYKFE